MPLPPRPRTARPARAGRRPSRARALVPLGAVLGLALVTTASAPGVLTLQRGDTLSDIAKRHGVSVAELRAANGLAPGERIYAGDTLVLPGSGAAATTPSAARSHTVRPGDTVSAVAVRYGVSQASVLRANGLSARSLLQPGQVLAVPAAEAGPAAPSVAQSRSSLEGRSTPSREQARALVAQTARRYGVDPSLALAIAYQESGFQQRVVSSVGAVGVMQVLPSTGRGLEREAGRPLDLSSTEDNITAGVLLLRQLQRSEGSTEALLAGYYQGIGSIAQKGVLPQTRQYIANIGALRERFRNG